MKNQKRHKKSLLEQQRAVQEVMVQMFKILFFSGKSEEDVNAFVAACISAAQFEMHQLPQLGENSNAQDFGSILRTWHRQARYLTSDGFPRPLSFEGQNGLRLLIAQYFPKGQVASIFSRLCATGLIRKNKSNKWVPTERHAVFPKLDSELLDHLSEGVSRLVETIIGNVTADRKEDALFERSAKVLKFPVNSAREFREFVKAQAIAFLSAVDDWMEAKAEASKGLTIEKCTAGVFTFAFMDGSRKRKVSRSNKAKKTVF